MRWKTINSFPRKYHIYLYSSNFLLFLYQIENFFPCLFHFQLQLPHNFLIIHIHMPSLQQINFSFPFFPFAFQINFFLLYFGGGKLSYSNRKFANKCKLLIDYISVCSANWDKTLYTHIYVVTTPLEH